MLFQKCIVFFVSMILFSGAAFSVDCESEARLEGFIGGINLEAGTLTVSGLTVGTDEETDYERRDFEGDPTLEDFEMGDLVRIDFCPGTGEIPIAVEIKEKSTEDNDESEIKGEITEINEEARTLVVNGILIRTNAETRFLSRRNERAHFEGFKVGDLVEVEGKLQSDNSILANKIESEDADQNETELKGIIVSIDSGEKTFRMEGVEVRTNESTLILEKEGSVLTFGDLMVGDKVEVEGLLLIEGVVLATKVEKKTDEDEEDKIEGRITAIEALTKSMTVNEIIIITTDTTTYKGDDGESLEFDDFEIHDLVEIEGVFIDDGVFLAEEIKKEEGREDCEDKIQDRILSLDLEAGTLVVGLVRFQTNSTTVIEDLEENEITLADLETGDRVRVKFCPDLGTPPIARRIQIRKERDEADNKVEIEGEIEVVDAILKTMTVNNTIIFTTGSTLFVGRGESPLTFDDFSPGDFIEVVGVFQEDDSVLAIKVKKEGEEFTCRNKLRAFITELDLNQKIILLGLVAVQVNESTELRDDRSDEIITFEDLKVGDSVKVEYCKTADIPLAAEVEVKNRDDFDIDGDSKVAEGEVFEFIDARRNGGVGFDLDGDGRTRPNDLYLLSNQWNQ